MRSEFGKIRPRHPAGRRTYLEASYAVPADLAGKYVDCPKRIYKSFAVGQRRQAREWLSSEAKLIDAGTWMPPKAREQQTRSRDITLNDYWKQWLEHRTWKGQPLRPGTVYVTRLSIINNILPYLGQTRLRDITQAMVDEWQSKLTVGAGARHNASKTLRAMLRTASKPGEHGEPPLIPRYPITRANPSPKRESHTIPATPQEVKTIYEHMPDAYKLTVYLSVYCGGLRIGEVCALQRRDISLKNQTLSVCRERITQGGNKLVGPPKTEDSKRTVDIPPQLMPLIKSFLRERVKPEPTAWLFPSANDPTRPVHPNVLRGAFEHARQAAGRPDLRYHDLRHTGLTMLAGEGATVRELMDEAGHSTADMAMRYQHEVDGRRRMLARRLGQLAAPVDAQDRKARIKELDEQIKKLTAERDRLIR